MGIFNKKVKFVSAICPECKGRLELDSNFETAFCRHCGAQFIMKNAPKKRTRQSKLETMVDFIERQQALRRQDKQERQRKIDEEELKTKEHLKKYWWIYTLIGVATFGFIFTMAILESLGVL